ncbi:MAG TPA: DUF885 domain-containing protein [Kineosporiaceae bacterium]
MTVGATSGSERFRRTAERVLDALLEESPEWATELGDHRFDDRLTDLSPDGVARRVARLHQATSALDDLDDSDLDPGDRVDLEILRTAVTREQWAAQELAGHTWDPLVHLPGEALYPLIARDGADPPHRIAALTARLAAVPHRLEVARSVLADMPGVHVETAIVRTRGTETLLGAVDALAASVVGPGRALLRARDAAADALREHRAWLQAQVAVSDGDPRLGPERYAAKLWYDLDSEIGPDSLLTRAESDLQAIEESIAEVASRIAGTPARPGQVREVLDRLAAQAPVDDTTILPLCERALADATARVRELDLVTVPHDPVRIIVMPPARWGVAVACCDPPGPLEPDGPAGPQPTFFAVSPTPEGWPPERIASFYREYNGHMLRNLAVHEAMPGHMLQLAHAARHRAGTRVRRALSSGAFVEGWAVYAEELMAGHGLGRPGGSAADDALRLQQLKMRLRSTINAILDVRVHTHGMSEAEAMALMTQRGHQEEGEAAGKWRRALLTSAQLSTYYVGVLQVAAVVAALRDAWPDASDRQLHDAVLAHGSPPPRHLRSLLGV